MLRRPAPRTSALLLLATLATSGPSVPEATLAAIPRSRLCLIEGTIDALPGNRLSVSVPKMRAYVDFWTQSTVEARFTYLGSTGNQALLGSGELRRQFGLKLRAQDACNLVYATTDKKLVSSSTTPSCEKVC
jgi:hypothetical protein